MIIIDSTNRDQNTHLSKRAYALRHEVFVEERGWENLRRADGLEIDAFDMPSAVEMLACEAGEVVGYQRLLPTMGPTLLRDIYPQLCSTTVPAADEIWEWTRFAVAARYRDPLSPSPIALDLTIALVQWCLARGIVAVVAEIDPVHLMRFVSCRFQVAPLGTPQRINNEMVIAILAGFNDRTLAHLLHLRALRTARTVRPRHARVG